MAEMTLQRLNADKSNTIGESFSVNYNPEKFSFSKGAQIAEVAIPGLDAPVLQFVRGDSETLSMELLFDSTESGMGASARSVTEKLDPFYRLIKVNGELHTPPIVRITWGEDFPGQTHNPGSRPEPAFDGVVTSLNREYTLFNAEGVPLRATVSLQLKEYRTLEEQLQALNLQSSDHTRVHVVQEGENLTTIAADAYGDPGQWRAIARHNKLRNVRELPPGQMLELPPTTE
ncbi:LysM peptidoglycan-binding domain-containing protein [Marinobacter lacisalsi]|uniref:LysM peptidoglycan-binding domain-containing protein n=1 Tax=Marinobacter lacisalsi TaxID=475979 RepID=A0ABV8QKV9_9GAMM